MLGIGVSCPGLSVFGRRFGQAVAALARLSPGGNWNGTAASGFASLPSDPVRTTAKPALRLITAPKQHSDTTILVGAFAAANDGGSLLDKLGIDKVRFHLEGSTADVTAPQFHTFPDANGNNVTYLGHWIELEHPGGAGGIARLYVEAFARDGTMQSRVIGPFDFGLRDNPIDGEIDVTPSLTVSAGVRYPNIADAIKYAKDSGWINYRLHLTEAGTYDIGDKFPTRWPNPGWCEIVADVAGCSIGKSGYTTDDAAKIKPAREPLRFIGSNLTLDFRYVVEINSFDGNVWCDGITIDTSDPRGFEETLRGGPPDQFGHRIDGGPYFTECIVSDVSGIFGKARLVRGCQCSSMTYDIFGSSEAMIGNVIDGHRGGFWYRDHACVSVTGPANSTLERSGTADAGVAVWDAKEGGVSVGTFTCGNGEDYYTGATGDGYTFSDLVAFLDGLTGWSATLTDADFADIRCCAGSLPGLKGVGFGATDASGGLTIVAMFDRHGDFYQPLVGGSDNIVIWGNRGWAMEAQILFLSPNPSGGSAELFDVVIGANGLANSDQVAGYFDPDENSSQFGRGTGVDLSHVVVVHNSSNQDWLVRNDALNNTADAYCLVANNVAKSFVWAGGNVLANFEPVDMHLFAGATAPSGGTGITIGGDAATLFGDVAAGDFAPAGALLASGAAPRIASDLARTTFPGSAAPGAIAGAAT